MASIGKAGSEISNDDSNNDEWNPDFTENIDSFDDENNVYGLDDEAEPDIFRNYFPEDSLEKFGSSVSSNSLLLNPSVSKHIANIASNEESDLIQYLGGNAPLNASTLTPTASRSPTMSVFSVERATKIQLEQGANELCMSKNAVAARENRKRKKNYVQQLESSIGQLKSENEHLKDKNNGLESTVEKLRTEIDYLKNIIANQSTLSHLIGHIHKTPGIKFQSSFTMYRPTTQSADKENYDENDNVKRPINCGTENEVSKNKQVCKRKATVRQNLPVANSGFETPPKRMCTRSKKVEKVNTRSSDSSATENDVLDESLIMKGETIHQSEACPTTCSSGICLHVAGDSISLEFCATCAKSASHAGLVAGDHCYGKSLYDG